MEGVQEGKKTTTYVLKRIVQLLKNTIRRVQPFTNQKKEIETETAQWVRDAEKFAKEKGIRMPKKREFRSEAAYYYTRSSILHKVPEVKELYDKTNKIIEDNAGLLSETAQEIVSNLDNVFKEENVYRIYEKLYAKYLKLNNELKKNMENCNYVTR